MQKAERIKNVALSPGVSVLVALLGAVGLLFTGFFSWVAVVLSVLAGAFMVFVAKGRALFRGSAFPIVALYLWLQAAIAADASGSLLALIAVGAIAMLFVCFANPGNTRIPFLTYLVCGLGALVSRSYAMLAIALFMPAILMHIFSMRGLVASLLGFITPLIILAGFGLYDPLELVDLYGYGWFIGADPFSLASVAVAAVSVLLTFFKAYGYPAKMRAGNMAMIGLTAVACVFPFIDSANALSYLPLINICSAYNLTHFAATTRFGWILALVVCLASGTALFLMPL